MALSNLFLFFFLITFKYPYFILFYRKFHYMICPLHDILFYKIYIDQLYNATLLTTSSQLHARSLGNLDGRTRISQRKDNTFWVNHF